MLILTEKASQSLKLSGFILRLCWSFPVLFALHLHFLKLRSDLKLPLLFVFSFE